MDRREKLEFILYQMKIMIKKKDYIRLYIISKKINEKNLEIKEIQDLKITYYAYMIEYYNHENRYLECSNCYKKIFETLD
jgi:26S proteasome regulatory subunit N5